MLNCSMHYLEVISCNNSLKYQQTMLHMFLTLSPKQNGHLFPRKFKQFLIYIISSVGHTPPPPPTKALPGLGG